MRQYMIEFNLPRPITEEFMSLVPEQRACVSKLFHKGSLISYTLDQNRTKLWVILMADDESELLYLIDLFPMSDFMDYNYHELMFHETVAMIPSMSLN